MSIVLEHLTKRYENHPVVNNVSLEVSDGEFFVLLGSSGSGKTTILSLIAGLTRADEGRVLLHGRDVSFLPPQKRKVGFVFQNYALFQYMTVADNIEFGLTVRKVASTERHRRRDELLELVGLAGLGNRMPRQLSGGQQQRVALARALACEPEVLLLDEPLGALDAKIRIDLRRTLRTIQRQLGIATILVTHDQEEAFDLADRIGVMSFGRLLEVGTPEDLYQRPQTEFVATFLGVANLLLGRTTEECVQVGPVAFPRSDQPVLRNGDNRVQVLFRPEDIALGCEATDLDCPILGQGVVEESSFGGSFERLRLRLPPLPGVRPIAPPVAFGSDSILLEATRSPDLVSRFPLHPGERAWVGVRRIHSLVHPGLNFLMVTDGSLRSQAALALGGQIARLAHARVTLMGCGANGDSLETHLQEARKGLGSGLASLEVLTSPEPPGRAVRKLVQHYPFDLVIMGFGAPEDLGLAGEILSEGEHHLLLVPGPQQAPTRALICVAAGEPGKDDVLFTGRLVRHLGADATLLTVLPPAIAEERTRPSAERFLEGGVQSLSVLGVPASTRIETGSPLTVIPQELKSGGYDLLVLGAPLSPTSGEYTLAGIIDELLQKVADQAVLIVRSNYMGAKVYQLPVSDLTNTVKEVVRG